MRRWILLLVSVALLFVLRPASVARACGGFFCQTMPVVQASENIAYAQEGDELVMSVQINYQGRAEDFAWILPVQGVPEISVGAQELFDELQRSTNPTYFEQTRTEGTCQVPPRCVYPEGDEGCGHGDAAGMVFNDSGPISFRPDGAAGAVDSGSGVTVHAEDVVGPYDTVVLEADTAAEVVDWLRTNDYDLPPATTELLEPYAAAGNVFVALRLNANSISEVIRPITLRIPTREVCLPLRLTAVASAETLPIRAYFLSDEGGYLSSNFSEVLIDETDRDNYRGNWQRARDAEIRRLEGQGFFTDYRGGTPRTNIAQPSMLDSVELTEPRNYLGRLWERNLLTHPLITDLLVRHMPMPPGETLPPSRYYLCVQRNLGCEAPSAAEFDPVGLSEAIETVIVEPTAEAQALVERHPRLTRLYAEPRSTEMRVDPVFELIPDLGDVPAQRIAEVVTLCDPDTYARHAPQEWRGGGAVIPLREGRTSGTPREYCREIGRVLESDDGRGCAAGRSGFVGGAWILLAVLVRRRRTTV